MDPLSYATAKMLPALIAKGSPKLFEIIAKECKELGAELNHALFNTFRKQMEAVYRKHSFFSSLVFPNKQLALVDFYLPLTLTVEEAGDKREVKVDGFPVELMSEKKHLLIVDQAGMGKSTIMKFMFLSAVDKELGIPVFIELRKLKKGEKILNHIYGQLKDIDGQLDERLVLRLIKTGEFIFLFDGYDEIPESDKEDATAELKEFKRLAEANRFIISSREQAGLAALPDFFRVNIRKLSFEEAAQLIKKYSQDSEIGVDLLDKLKDNANNSILEFLTNPLLVSLLFKAYEFKQAIPLKKHIFYRQVFEALFENHDLSKDAGQLNRKKASNLDIHSFDKVMRNVGFLSLESGRVEYEKEGILRLFERVAKSDTGIPFNPHALLHDLLSQVPLFVADGNYFRWNHKSIQEYFAALYLAESGPEFQRQVLPLMYHSHNANAYVNFITLYADLDPTRFRRIFLPLLLNEILDEWKVKGVVSGVDYEIQRERLSLTVFREVVIFNLDSDELEIFEKSFDFEISDDDNEDDDSERGVGLDLFEPARTLLRERNKGFVGAEGHHPHEHPVCVTFADVRLSVIRQLSQFLPDDVLDCKLRLPRANKTRLAERLPIKGLVVDALADNPLNLLENYSEVNLLLGNCQEKVVINAENARTLLSKIATEELLEKDRRFNF
jgi:hypothetical protein